ncbi:ion channel [Nitzschia inconspicua]|uniref:Ion channel n=1 Tax=Nitzschia inconspicua TaxID=303405 RepID=A0A9K3M1V5_9STRA|nr:ion channel [Nitzschia inconspicua]
MGILGSMLLEIKENRRWHENFATEYEAMTLFDRDDQSSDGNYDSEDDCGYFEPVSNDSDGDESGEKEEVFQQEGPAIMSGNSDSNGSHSKEGDKNVTFCRSTEKGSNDFKVKEKSNEAISQPSSSCSRDNRHSAKRIDSRTTYPIGGTRFIVLLTIAMFFAFLIGYKSNWGFWSTVYYAVTTAATIGYGDLTPHTQEERFLAVIFIPFACAVTGHCLAWFAKWSIEKQGAKYRKNAFDSHKELTPEDLKVMDITGDGKVAWFEFLEFMLVAMKKVDPELLDELRDYFDRLDVSQTGELSNEDLIEIARRKMRSPRRKLELYEYKRHLLNISLQTNQRESVKPELEKWLERSLGFFGVSARHLPTTNQDEEPTKNRVLPERRAPS